MKIAAKPEGVLWSDDQWKAIAARGQNMLVSAAAGSGKTAVLVERIARQIIHDGIDVDQLLIVTFTNAAAAEMKARIGQAIEKAIAADPSSSHLRRQLTLLNRAQISTIHSFCMNVLRRYYYKIGIDPAFRVVDDAEAELMREEVMEDLFEEQYGIEENEGFFELVDCYTGDRNDAALQTLVEKLYDFSRSHQQPDQWLVEMAEDYRVPEEASIEDLKWGQDLLDAVMMRLEGCKAMLLQAVQLTYEPGGPSPYQSNLTEDLAVIDSLASSCKISWTALYDSFQSASFGRLKSVKGSEYDEDLKEKTKGLRDEAKKQIGKIRDELFARPPERMISDLRKMAPHVETLAQLVIAFARRYKDAKLKKGLIDFDDSQHFCLDILIETETGKPSEAAIAYRDQFKEVLVDEYQDTNFVQEAILRCITDGSNLFMVGDVKQSVYRFRQAEPGLFLEKYKRFKKDGSGEGLKINLSQNFRSRKEVLEGTNFLFRQLMDEEVGEIQYDDAAALRLGFVDYPEVEANEAEFMFIDREAQKDEPSETEDLQAVQLEARLISEKIEKLISGQHQVFDKTTGRMRAITYRDIAILLRSASTAAPAMLEEFKQRGIPAYAELSSGYFEAIEVEVMLSLLKIIDNPHQDIPLASVLRSPMVGLSGKELAEIRIAGKKGNYYEAVRGYLEKESGGLADKLEHFIGKLNSWRTMARRGSLSALIWQVFRDTGYYDFAGGMPGGRQRQANLRALYDRARQYETTSFRGLFRFLRFVERIRERGSDLGTARSLGEQEDVVRVMTIHKSKGLEYPVVFVANLNKQFNFSDSRGNYMLHKELGFGTKYIDPKRRISYPTLAMQAMKRKSEMEMLAEEMRVLYVALTRAREKLYLIGTVKQMDKTVEQWRTYLSHSEWVLPSYLRSAAKSYLDWIGPAVIRHRDAASLFDISGFKTAEAISSHPSKWRMTIVPADHLKVSEPATKEQREGIETVLRSFRTVPLRSDQKAEVENRLSWAYSYEDSTVKMSKQTVTEIKRQRESLTNGEGSDTQYIRQFRRPIAERPQFMQETRLTSAERGTAMHAVMQHVDVSEGVTETKLKESVSRLVVQELITEEEARAVDIHALLAFFNSDLGARMVKALRVEREAAFSLALPAEKAYSDWKNAEEEPILIQGVIDCLIEEEDGMVLIDYKTDAIKGRFQHGFEGAKPILAERYRVQLELYSQAISRIWKKPLKEKYLYFFDGGHWLPM